MDNWTTQDLLALLTELVKWIDAYLPKDKRPDLKDQVARTAYSNYRIHADTAYATATCDGKRHDQRFRRIDGVWFID